MPNRRSSAAASLLALVLAACGGSSEEAPPPATPAPQPAADHYTGHWRGLADITSTVPDAPSEMGVEATIVQGGGQCGTFEYGSIACSGVWMCTSSYDAPTMRIEERVRYGNERCPDGARVELSPTDEPDQLLFRYTGPQIQATGTLERVQTR
ncbi:MAG TPA: hypothetical protein RMH99_29910 [Sandaracinaceae bacterium LLY-WYZ-13_1]|nr:hypothetical protein [Sandaracinaceae bacterium LLY-WYZ-13_1]